VTLAPLDADILRALLAVRYDGEASVAGLDLSALPYLSRLSVDDLMLALRAPDAAGAVGAIRVALSPARTSSGTLADFPLPADVRKTVEQMIADLRAWSDGALPWSDVTRGLLLAGPPGCGKTELARLIGQEAGLSVISGSLGQWSAESARSSEMVKAMRTSFTQAAEQAPALVFIDELDAFGDRTRAPDQNTAYTDFIVTALLDLMDGFDGREGVVIMGATNHIWKIDAAIRRPGRFDTVLKLEQPNVETMPQALRWQLGADLPDSDLSGIAKAALGLSGADVAALVRSARATARSARRPLCEADLTDAITALRPPLPPALRWRVAIHEAGHAIVATATSGARPRLLTIESEGGGMHARAAASANTRAVLETRIAIALAGHAAETMILGAPSGGSGGGEESDLAFATQIAAMIEESLGLGETLVYLSPDDRAKDRLRIDPAQRRLIEGHLRKNHERAMRLLEANRAQLIALATALDAEGILHGDALAQLLSDVIPEQTGDGGVRSPGQLSRPAPDQDAAAPLTSEACPDSAPAPDTCPATSPG
jgi:ATP-dependent Zn protease